VSVEGWTMVGLMSFTTDVDIEIGDRCSSGAKNPAQTGLLLCASPK
jgi:hypothetical protein